MSIDLSFDDDKPVPPGHDLSIPAEWYSNQEDVPCVVPASAAAHEYTLEDEVPDLSQEEMYALEADRWEYDDDVRGATIDWSKWGRPRDW